MGVLEPLATQSQLPLSPRFRRRLGKSGQMAGLVRLVLLISIAIVMLLPFAWLASSSLKTQNDVFQYPPQWIPNPPQFQNYVDALTYKPFGTYLKNTLIITVLNVIAVVCTSSLDRKSVV